MLEHIDPKALEIADNVRDNATEGKHYADLVASVGEVGVVVPVCATRDADGKTVVRDGQRRTLAARAVGLDTVPVYVVSEVAEDDKSRTVARITGQMVANDHRAALTETQRAKAIQQLLLEGVSPAKVAKSLTVPKALVHAAAAAAQSPQAMDALSTTQLTIEQAAVLAEFDAEPDAIQYLCDAATLGEFDHRVSELRSKAQSEAAWEAAAQPLRDQGYTVLGQQPSWSSDLSRARLDRLCDAQGNSPAEDIVAQRPQLWAVWLEEAPHYVDTRTGNQLSEDDIDWDLEPTDVDAEAEQGYVHPCYVEESTTYQAEFYCLDLDQVSLFARADYYRNRDRGIGDANTEDLAARKEAERREKRKVVALNRLGHAAIEVRRAWVKERLLAHKTPEKGAALFIAEQLSAEPHLLATPNGISTAAVLLGLSSDASVSAAVSALPTTADARASVITLGLVLGALEAQTPKDAWRRTYSSNSKSYLSFLSDHGYELSDIERVIVGRLKADTLYDRLDAAKKAQAAG
ncbi:ParB N-terminal domain-containing protein [Mycobacterium sp. 050128]|uniref:ParB/RepB/Spo0J family partition protein n=1 Tax=Mycobacterium sp. 050128 TaxID=3096112 RepID=UPI002EDB2111